MEYVIVEGLCSCTHYLQISYELRSLRRRGRPACLLDADLGWETSFLERMQRSLLN
jgi:hypothetical protein